LSWNANGSLGQLAMTDSGNTQNGQTCQYAHDDLARIASVNCGTNSYNWVQGFSYDAFGNVKKAGSQLGVSFQPAYASATNRYASLPSGSPAYDANGNVKADGFHSYAWDADGNLTVLDANPAMVYDALDRRVEQTVSGTTSEILYSLDGAKLALLNGAAVSQLFVGLPGGSRAIYTASGLAYYQYGNWLGSERETTTPAGSIVHDGMYGPYGETYNETGSSSLRNFTGQEANLALDLYDFSAREYHPIQGRWLQPDPAGLGAVDYTNPQSWNRYGYVLGNPLGFTDPTGLTPIWVGCPDCTVTVYPGTGGPGGGAGGGTGPVACAIVTDSSLHPHMMCGEGGGGEGGGGGGAATPAPAKTGTSNVTKTYPLTTPCAASSQKVM
jgi:RHS repeat-associated protein